MQRDREVSEINDPTNWLWVKLDLEGDCWIRISAVWQKFIDVSEESNVSNIKNELQALFCNIGKYGNKMHGFTA